MLGSFGDYALVAHGEYLGSKLVAIDELGVAEHLGRLTEEFLDFLVMHLDLVGKLLGIDKRCERVSIGLGQKLHAAGVGEFLEQVDKLGDVHLKLLESGACDGDGTLEGSLGVLDHLEEALGGGDVAALGYAGDDVVVGKVVIIVVVVAYVKEAVSFQTEWLMYLEVEADCFHYFAIL